jgi:hypothetical protein
MPLHLCQNVYESGSVPAGWTPSKSGTIKYPVKNTAVLKHLRELAIGRWQKVIKPGNTGEIHYFEHESEKSPGSSNFLTDWARQT